MSLSSLSTLHFVCFFFCLPHTTLIYSLSLHDALPISRCSSKRDRYRRSRCSRLPELPEMTAREEDSGSSGNRDRKSTRLNSSHVAISYAVFCLKKKKVINSLNKNIYELQLI